MVCLIWDKLKDFFDLHGDIASLQEITERINAGVQFRGTNLSVLILAIFIASLFGRKNLRQSDGLHFISDSQESS